MKYLGYDLLNRYGIIHKFKVPPATLEIFLVKIEEGYCKFKNPYHNNLHAADVAQTVHHVLCQTGLMHWMSDLEIFATLLAALVHDFEVSQAAAAVDLKNMKIFNSKIGSRFSIRERQIIFT